MAIPPSKQKKGQTSREEKACSSPFPGIKLDGKPTRVSDGFRAAPLVDYSAETGNDGSLDSRRPHEVGAGEVRDIVSHLQPRVIHQIEFTLGELLVNIASDKMSGRRMRGSCCCRESRLTQAEAKDIVG